MRTATKKSTAKNSDTFSPSPHITTTLGKVWTHWVDGLGHTKAAAEKKMKAAVNDLHKKETGKTASKARTTKSSTKSKKVARSKSRAK